jgi:predicted transcriptional regulator
MQEHDKLYLLLEKLNKPRQEVADFLGINERTLYRWLAGDTRIPKFAFKALQLLSSGK